MRFVEIGKLRHRITLNNRQMTPNSNGFTSFILEPIATVWGSIKPLTGRELYQAAAVNAEVTTQINIRYRKSVTTDLWLAWEDHIYDILSVIDVEQHHRELKLLVKEVLPSG